MTCFMMFINTLTNKKNQDFASKQLRYLYKNYHNER